MERKGSILSTDFSEVDKMQELWLEKRKKKGQIYRSLAEYALFLESMLDSMDDDYEKWLIERELKKLKKLQKEYYVPSLLEQAALYNLKKSTEEKKNSLEKSSYSLVKRIQDRR
ncbi:MAG: hypothetical protein MR598_02890 [Erysipelotrichaceae bacterium]|nr:hypothetical protein [Erysipelotrichaceae bacterium]